MSEQGRLDQILGNRANGLTKPEPKDAADDIVELPEPGADYKAYANTANKPVYTLHCLKGAEGIFSFAYVQLDSHSTFKAGEHGQVITLKFAGSKIWEVTITGTNLRELYDGIHRHVIPWVRQSDRGFQAGADGDSLIMGIAIKDVTPRE
jgi:hypothetical protein